MKSFLLFLFFSLMTIIGYADTPEAPNVIIIMTDNQGYNDLGGTGYPT